ncbi:hypothetical protein S40293_03908 [Stachybotrys chartarum IBT 40293]|jgi:transcriptional regulator GlxA family with amidase domain|nr:hypothetical protein S40293_03908 [Stachybotrys chartarum IBT 40293]KFA81428.1 hypothetical protein S40288_07298 [Stachybotrys chartarum IBT 40288]
MHFSSANALGLLAAASLAVAQNGTTPGCEPPIPQRFGIVLFPAFTPLDVFGPLDMLNGLSLTQHMNLSIIAETLDPVTTQLRNHNVARSNFSQSVVPTHTFANPPEDLDVLFVPGGAGTRAVNSPNPDLRLTELIAYIRDVYPSLQYIISVCTGAQLLAQAGVLDGRNATTNKAAWASMTRYGPRTYWRAQARWVKDHNVYTTSGVSAGIDGTLQFIEDVWGEERANTIAYSIEHSRTSDPDNDPFAAHFGAVDVPPVE